MVGLLRRYRAGRACRLALLTTVGLLATAGVAIATTALTNAYTDSQGVYHGCVNNGAGSGLLRVVVPGTPCKAGETAIDWNRTGPQGPPGPPGPKGDPGDPGPSGGSLVGSACTTPGVGGGHLQMSVAPDGAVTLSCDARIVSRPPEDCNGLDDDGNGEVDDMIADRPVPHGVVVCRSPNWFTYCFDGWSISNPNGYSLNGCDIPPVSTRAGRD
jgi:hypothetical protein